MMMDTNTNTTSKLADPLETRSTTMTEQNNSVKRRHLHRDSDGSDHLMVTGLYDDDAHERKSSISFDKIKQISLSYSLQSDEEAEGSAEDELKGGQGAGNRRTSGAVAADPDDADEYERRESSGSCCLSPSQESRKISVIELGNMRNGAQYRIGAKLDCASSAANSDSQSGVEESRARLEQADRRQSFRADRVFVDKTNQCGPAAEQRGSGVELKISEDHRSRDHQEGSAAAAAAARYLQSNPFAYDNDGQNLQQACQDDGYDDYEENSANYNRNSVENRPHKVATDYYQTNQYSISVNVDEGKRPASSDAFLAYQSVASGPAKGHELIGGQVDHGSVLIDTKSGAIGGPRLVENNGGFTRSPNRKQSVNRRAGNERNWKASKFTSTPDPDYRDLRGENKSNKLRHLQRPRELAGASANPLASNNGRRSAELDGSASMGLRFEKLNTNSISLLVFNETPDQMLSDESLSDESCWCSSNGAPCPATALSVGQTNSSGANRAGGGGGLAASYLSQREDEVEFLDISNGLGRRTDTGASRDENLIVDSLSSSSSIRAAEDGRGVGRRKSSKGEEIIINQRRLRKRHQESSGHHKDPSHHHHHHHHNHGEKFDSNHKNTIGNNTGVLRGSAAGLRDWRDEAAQSSASPSARIDSNAGRELGRAHQRQAPNEPATSNDINWALDDREQAFDNEGDMRPVGWPNVTSARSGAEFGRHNNVLIGRSRDFGRPRAFPLARHLRGGPNEAAADRSLASELTRMQMESDTTNERGAQREEQDADDGPRGKVGDKQSSIGSYFRIVDAPNNMQRINLDNVAGQLKYPHKTLVDNAHLGGSRKQQQQQQQYHHQYTSPLNSFAGRQFGPSYEYQTQETNSLFGLNERADDSATSSNSIYATPIRRTRSHQVGRDVYDDRIPLRPSARRADDGQRIDIVISSPQRYARPQKGHSETRWSNCVSPVGIKFNIRNLADQQPQLEASHQHQMAANQQIYSARANRRDSGRINYRRDSPTSSFGSPSRWSQPGSFNQREFDKTCETMDNNSKQQQQQQHRSGHSAATSLGRPEGMEPRQEMSTYDIGAQRSQIMGGQAVQRKQSRMETVSNQYCADERTESSSKHGSNTDRNNNNNHQRQSSSPNLDGPTPEACLAKVGLDVKEPARLGPQQAAVNCQLVSQQADRANDCCACGATLGQTRGQDKGIGLSASGGQQVEQTKSNADPLTSGCPLFASSASTMKRPIKLRNLITGDQVADQLSNVNNEKKALGCDETRCLGALLDPKSTTLQLRPKAQVLEQARTFINNYYASIKRLDSEAHKNRLTEIEEQVRTTDTYYLKETELIYGAKLAWRNASRCIGRIQWSKLQVFDARFTTNANEMFEAICNHIKYATNKGSLRSAITILPPRVKSTKNDWRIWNNQLIGYAGYRNKETGEIVGDPANAELTDICIKLGWKGAKGGRFDILPLVLSAAGGGPQMFSLPDDIVLRVKIRHPKYKWFEELDLEWYALPAVSSMMLDVGGLQFTAAPFSGWYMVTEIGTRDLADVNRYNMLEEVAQRMGLNTKSNMSLWKDQAVVQLNIAVLDSFQSAGVTIVDHHTASETFMTHLSNEQRLRGGCPADWVWLVPPTSGSTTQVFHQEMVNYHLLPNYEYLEPIWKGYDWAAWERQQQEKLDNAASAAKRNSIAILEASNSPGRAANGLPLSPSGKLLTGAGGELTPRKLRFKEIARAVKFTSKLFGKALSRRIKATILYATETGKSERFANKLAQTFSCAFNVHLMSMSDYDMTCLEHEALLLVVTSTFGNGDPPENGELFAKHLAAVKLTGDTSPDIDSINSVSTNPFFQMLSEDHKDGLSTQESDEDSELGAQAKRDKQKQEQQTNIRPLSNVRFGVFALGSTAYPHFCAYGRYVDQTLGELGAERIHKCTCGDELSGQEKAFNEWSSQIFKTACDVFCLTDTIGPLDERPELVWSPLDVRFVPVEIISETPKVDENNNGISASDQQTVGTANKSYPPTSEILVSKKTIVRNLMSITNKKIIPFTVKDRVDLHPFRREENLQTMRIDLESDFISGPETKLLLASQTINATATSLKSPSPMPLISFEAGDHIAIYPVNKLDMVEKILERMRSDLAHEIQPFDFDRTHTILVKRENMDLTPASAMATAHGAALGGGKDNNWITHDRLPVTSIREALTRYLDITTPPNQEFLLILSRQTNDVEDKKRLLQMGKNFTVYEDWKNKKVPTLLSVLEEFKTIKFEPALVTQIPLMKPRFYSVSGTSVSLTLGVVRFKTNSGELREGLCSNYLNRVPIGPTTHLFGYIRSAPAFHMPQDRSIPMILISAGTGIAPFRSFWQQRYADIYKRNTLENGQQQQIVAANGNFGRIEMYFGCRNSNYILYKDELDEMYENGVISSINIAFSRPADCDILEDNSTVSGDGTNINCSDFGQTVQAKVSKVASIKQARKRMYVQDRLLEDCDDIHKLIMVDGAHIYVCGDVAMADGVCKTLATIFNNSFKANKSAEVAKCDPPQSADSAVFSSLGADLAKSFAAEDGEGVLMNLRNLNRYHEDIFGAKQVS